MKTMVKLLSIIGIVVFSFQNTFAQNKTSGQQLFQSQKKNAIKINVLSPFISEHLAFSYERAIQPRQSLELNVGLIGVGIPVIEPYILNEGTPQQEELSRTGSGVFFEAGYKIFPPFRISKKPHILKGLYLQPDVIFGFYTRNKVDRNTDDSIDVRYKQKVNYQAILLNIGAQFVIKESFLVDLFWGIGRGNDNVPPSENEWIDFGEFHRGLYKFDEGKSAAMKAGIKIGYLF